MAANPTISPMAGLLRLVSIRESIDNILADKPNEEVEANLYSARLHILNAIREQAAVVQP